MKKKSDKKTAMMMIGSARKFLRKTEGRVEYIGYAKAQLFFGAASGHDAHVVVSQMRDERKREDTLLLLVFEQILKEACTEEHYAIRVGVDSRRASDFMSFFDDHSGVREYIRTGKMTDLDNNPCTPDACVTKNEKILRRIYDLLVERDITLIVQFDHPNIMADHAQHTVLMRWREEKGKGDTHDEHPC